MTHRKPRSLTALERAHLRVCKHVLGRRVDEFRSSLQKFAGFLGLKGACRQRPYASYSKPDGPNDRLHARRRSVAGVSCAGDKPEYFRNAAKRVGWVLGETGSPD